MDSSCKKGYYFCNTSQKCKKIPRGHKVKSDGYLVREYVSDWRSDMQEVAPSAQGLSTLKDRKNIQNKIDNVSAIQPISTTQNQKSGQALPTVSVKGVNRFDYMAKQMDKIGSINDVKVKMDADGNVPDAGAFAQSQLYKGLDSAADLMKNNPTAMAAVSAKLGDPNMTPEKFKQQGKSALADTKFNINKNVPGTQAFRLGVAADEINKSSQKFKNIKSSYTPEGITVENYADGVKFTEIETVDIIKPKALDASDWRNDLIQVDEKYKFLRTGNKKDMTKGKGDKTPVDYSKILAASPNPGPAPVNPKDIPTEPSSPYLPGKSPYKKIFASYEKDLENMIIEILEEDVDILYKDGLSYEEIAEFYDVKDELLNEGLIKGAIEGGKIIAKFAPKIAKFAANRGIKDRKILTQFVKNPKNWQKANKDIDVVGKLPSRVYAAGQKLRQITDRGIKALKGSTQKLIEPLKRKGQEDIAKWNKTQEVIKRANSLARTKAEKAGKIVDIAKKTTDLPAAKKSLPLTKKVTQGMKPKEIRSKGMNLLAKLQGKTEKTKKAAELNRRMAGAIEVSKKPTTYSGKVDAAIKLPNPGSLVKSKGSALSNVKGKSTSFVDKVKTLMFGAKKTPKAITGSTKPKAITGSTKPKAITGSTKPKAITGSTKPKVKSNSSKVAVGTSLGVVAGGLTASQQKTNKTAVTAKSNSIVNDGKKIVDPKKNDTISTSKKNTTSKNVNQWGRSKQYTADDGKTTVDRSDVFTKAAFDFGPNIKKGQAIGVVTRNQRKSYDLEATKRKNVKEGVAAIPAAIPLVKGAIKVGGAVLAAKGGEEGIKKVIDTFRKRRDAQKEYKDSINKGIQNTRDSEADKRVADAARDPDLKKMDRRPPDNSTPKDVNSDFIKTMKALKRGTTKNRSIPNEDKIKILKKGVEEFKKGGKGKPSKK